MEHFKGNLSSYRLSLMMPALFEQGPVTGRLLVERGPCRREFSVEHGAVVAERSTDPREHLAQVLADLRILPPERSAAAFEAAEGSGQPLGRFLVDRGFVEQGRLGEALAHKAREAFFDSYRWESGEVEFIPGEGPARHGVEMKLPLSALHRDAMARLREWRAFHDVFPEDGTRFSIHRAPEPLNDVDDELLLKLAEGGGSLAELLAAGREGALQSARRVLRLYRRGLLSPKSSKGRKLGTESDVPELVARARLLLDACEFEKSLAIATEVLSRAAVPEAQSLYREAEIKLGFAVCDELLAMEGRLQFQPLPHPVPAQLTADDLYVYSRLRSSRSIRDAVRTAAMGELAAYRCIKQLFEVGLLAKAA